MNKKITLFEGQKIRRQWNRFGIHHTHSYLTNGFIFDILEVAKNTRSDPFGHGGF